LLPQPIFQVGNQTLSLASHEAFCFAPTQLEALWKHTAKQAVCGERATEAICSLSRNKVAMSPECKLGPICAIESPEIR
ncbi:hypothetical protein, partial [Ruegeria arenilitoris]|uniref:hypothetical protein n=1 Tax=Ruegeria arenilitoris TaxID=1173585 RepID=UPI001C2CB6CF